MTPKQIERIKIKITAIKKEIAREKKQWGGYHDGRGLRYAPPQYYVQLGDFKDEYISVEIQLLTEPAGAKRSALVNKKFHLLD